MNFGRWECILNAWQLQDFGLGWVQSVYGNEGINDHVELLMD